MNREAGRGGRRDRHEGRQQGGGRRDGGHGRGRDGQGRQRSGSRGQGGPRRGWSSSRPSERSRRTTSSRQVAWEGLRTVREEDAYAHLVLSGLLRRHRGTARDAAFTTELFYGSLRAQGRLAAILAAGLARHRRDAGPELLDVMRLGAYQLLDMTVAPHAAASETVALARQEVGAGAASFANAVLRRIGERTLPEWIERVAPDRETDLVGHLSVVHSHPAWMVRALSDALAGHGRDRPDTDEPQADPDLRRPRPLG